MCRYCKILALPALALLLAGAALVAQNVSAGTGGVTPGAVDQPAEARAVDSDTPKTIADWQETGNIRNPPPKNPTSPPIHPIRP
jgi:hypothetical protein